jgi:hypothetical protein
MNAVDLMASIAGFFQAHAGTYGLDPALISIRYILNDGGFVNHSYGVEDAHRRFHLKLAVLPEYRAGLERWMKVAPLLTEFHAPPIIDWIDVGNAAGLLFPFLPGTPPVINDESVDIIAATLGRLHSDTTLARILELDKPLTARESYIESLHTRFIEDLDSIRHAPPPFVDNELIKWLDHEVRRILEEIDAHSAFDEILTKPVHGDLWPNNILWVSRDEWHIIDWDDMRIGDPAADFATLLGPSIQDLTPLKNTPRISSILSPAERERLPLLGRATLLDWIIDPVADWIEAVAAPEHMEMVRSQKQSVHHRALQLYTELY